jgi:predicted transcriptional regulator
MMEALKKKAKKGIAEVVQYAVSHKIHVHVLIVLNEGAYTAGEISEILGIPINTLHNHLRRMLADGSIEIAKEEKKGNMIQFWYRAVERKSYTVEEFEKLPFAYQQNIVGAIVQCGTAEVLAGLYGGQLADPRATVFWDWYNLDAQGRKEADARTERYVEEMQDIECEAVNRAAKTGEKLVTMVLNLTFFERPRMARMRRRAGLVTE